jgi:hypothetical protein
MGVLTLKIFNVGEGDCIVAMFPDGAIGLIDSCVPPWLNASPALSFLRDRGGHVSFVCLTHPHLDHYGGMLQLVRDRGIHVDEFWHPFHSDLYEVVKYKSHIFQYGTSSAFADLLAYESRAAEFPRLMNWARDLSPGKERTVAAGKVLRDVPGLYQIVGLAPSDLALSLYIKRIRRAWDGNCAIDGRYENRVSAVLLIRFGTARILLGADAYAANWREILRGPIFRVGEDAAHCFKAAHHGSRYGFYQRMWGALLTDSCEVIVSAGGSRLASREFVESASVRYRLWCTGCGPSCPRSSNITGFSHLDEFSMEEDGPACFNHIEVQVQSDGKVTITPDRWPPEQDLRCRRLRTLEPMPASEV